MLNMTSLTKHCDLHRSPSFGPRYRWPLTAFSSNVLSGSIAICHQPLQSPFSLRTCAAGATHAAHLLGSAPYSRAGKVSVTVIPDSEPGAHAYIKVCFSRTTIYA